MRRLKVLLVKNVIRGLDGQIFKNGKQKIWTKIGLMSIFEEYFCEIGRLFSGIAWPLTKATMFNRQEPCANKVQRHESVEASNNIEHVSNIGVNSHIDQDTIDDWFGVVWPFDYKFTNTQNWCFKLIHENISQVSYKVWLTYRESYHIHI